MTQAISNVLRLFRANAELNNLKAEERCDSPRGHWSAKVSRVFQVEIGVHHCHAVQDLPLQPHIRAMHHLRKGSSCDQWLDNLGTLKPRAIA